MEIIVVFACGVGLVLVWDHIKTRDAKNVYAIRVATDEELRTLTLPQLRNGRRLLARLIEDGKLSEEATIRNGFQLERVNEAIRFNEGLLRHALEHDEQEKQSR